MKKNEKYVFSNTGQFLIYSTFVGLLVYLCYYVGLCNHIYRNRNCAHGVKRQSPFSATNCRGHCSRQCGQGFRLSRCGVF